MTAVLRARDLALPVGDRPLLMGILNANSDSFSDPGARTLEALVTRATDMVRAGASIVDIGAQSAITGRRPVEPADEIARVTPVIAALADALPGVALSVDTYKPSVVEAALDAGAHMVNDVSGLADEAVARSAARYGAALVLMHTAAPPLVRRQDPYLYGDVAAEVGKMLASTAARAVEIGVDPDSIVVDPGVDFAKTPAQSLRLLRDIRTVSALGYPMLLALSRKDFVGALLMRSPAGRDPGTLGAVLALRGVPCQILRVHDVAATADAIKVYDALTDPQGYPGDLDLADWLRHEG